MKDILQINTLSQNIELLPPKCAYVYEGSTELEFINCFHYNHILELPISIYRDEIADLTMEDIALAIAMESLEDIDG